MAFCTLRRLFFPALLALPCLLFDTANALPKPVLRTRMLSGSVRVRAVLFTSLRHRRHTNLVVQRSNDGHNYTVIKRIKRPGKSLTIFDTNDNSSVWYRGRVVGSIQTPWSRPARALPEAVTPEAPILPDIRITVPTDSPPPPLHDALLEGQSECESDFLQRVIDRTNFHRREASLADVSANDLLMRAARSHSITMGFTQNMTHDNWLQEILQTGYMGLHFGQNVAFYIKTPEGLVDALMTSAGHRANILKPSYTEIGVGCIVDDTGKPWWTQNFGG